MTRTTFLSVIAGALLLATAAAAATTGEFDNMCAEGLALGKNIATDCSVNAVIDGKTFGNEATKTLFMKDPQGNLAKAQAYYSSKP